VVSPQFVLQPGKPVPFLAFPESVSHKRAIEVLEAQNIPFRMILTSRDLATHFALCERGRGVMVFPERFVPDSLRIADWLPAIPALSAGIYVRDGFEPPYLAQAVECLAAAFKP
jgi:DNA-binding transcriptional LysR family regulator